VDIEIDGRYLRHANPTSERISDNARRRARNNRRVIQIEDAPPARLLMRFTYEAPWKNAVPRFYPSLSLSLSLSLSRSLRERHAAEIRNPPRADESSRRTSQDARREFVKRI